MLAHRSGFAASTRAATHLRQLAVQTWPPDSFAARWPAREIAPLALRARGEAARALDGAALDGGLAFVREHRDCQDFAMAALLRVLLRFGDDPQLASGWTATISSAIQDTSFWWDQAGDGRACWSTENHQILYASCELLAGETWPTVTFPHTGRSGAWHAQHARQRIDRWLTWRLRFGLSEWNSSCYVDEDGIALLNLIDFAHDPQLRERATRVLDAVLRHLAGTIWQGGSFCAQGRAYRDDALVPTQTSAAAIAGLLWGTPSAPAPGREGHFTTSALCTSTYQPPTDLAAIAAHCDGTPTWQRLSVDPAHSRQYGVDPDDAGDLLCFEGAGLNAHPLVTETHARVREHRERWPGFFRARDHWRACRARGETLDDRGLPHALSEAHIATWRSPHHVLSCAQDWRPGCPGYQQLVWIAGLGPDAPIFSTNPAPADIPFGRPGRWVGNGMLPRVLATRDLLVCLHRVRPMPILDDAPWYHEPLSHCCVPRARCDEVIDANGWCFLRRGQGFAALRSLTDAQWQDDEELAVVGGTAWVAAGRDTGWLLRLGSAAEWGDFATFVRAHRDLRVQGDLDHTHLTLPDLGRIDVGWERPLTVAGAPAPTRTPWQYDDGTRHIPYGSLPEVPCPP